MLGNLHGCPCDDNLTYVHNSQMVSLLSLLSQLLPSPIKIVCQWNACACVALDKRYL